jgi:hypothetical protein
MRGSEHEDWERPEGQGRWQGSNQVCFEEGVSGFEPVEGHVRLIDRNHMTRATVSARNGGKGSVYQTCTNNCAVKYQPWPSS